MEYKEEKLSRAISASSRRQILRILSKHDYTVKEIAQLTKMSVSLASRHLKLLYDLGFLNVRKIFPNKIYSIKVEEIVSFLDAYDQVEKKGFTDDEGEKLSRAISAGTRKEILRQLASKEMTVKDVSNVVGMSVSLASRHLKMLYDLGFLKVRKSFPNKFYSLKIKELVDLLEHFDKVIEKI